jgi:thymidine kinase
MVARIVDGKLTKTGDQIVVGGHDMYVSLCRKHYTDGRIGPKLQDPNAKDKE